MNRGVITTCAILLLAFWISFSNAGTSDPTLIRSFQVSYDTQGLVVVNVSTSTVTNTIQAFIGWLDRFLQTNALLGTNQVIALINTAGSNEYTVITQLYANVATTNWTTNAIYRAPNFSNYASRAEVSNHLFWSANRLTVEYSGSNVKFPALGTFAVVSTLVSRVTASFGALANGDAVTITTSGLYLVRGECHFLNADANFRDYNKEAIIYQNGSERIINLGTVDSLNSVISSFGIVSLTNGAYIQLMGQSYYTNLTTCDYGRIDVIPLGTYDGFR